VFSFVHGSDCASRACGINFRRNPRLRLLPINKPIICQHASDLYSIINSYKTLDFEMQLYSAGLLRRGISGKRRKTGNLRSKCARG
jgi:hypothetical protein